MRIEVRSPNTSLETTVRENVARHLRFALGRYATRIHAVTATLTDANGPRGGEDKHCRIQLRGIGLDVTVTARGTDFSMAAALASDRMARSVGRMLDLESTRSSSQTARWSDARGQF